MSVTPLNVRTKMSPSLSNQSTNGACRFDRVQTPCIIVIFGATGDLTARKLFPSLHALFLDNALPENFCIVGASRSELTDEAFRDKMLEALEKHSRCGAALFEVLAKRLFYRQVRFDAPEDFVRLKHSLDELHKEHSTHGNALYYLAVPPSAYEVIARNLGEAGLHTEHKNWARIVIEKPFGRDLESARRLDAAIHEYFSEPQVFRIDHYLAKETVQNILMLRFANAIFEPVWNRRYIDYVRIMAAESLGVEHRAGYYDQSGVLRDMFQNHMMQLLSLIAMEPPSHFEADLVRDEKTKVYRALRPFPVDNLNEHLVLGQYASGIVNAEKVPGYLDEKGVSMGSLTPTFAAMKVYVDNWRWQGVPFYICSGKRMPEKRTELAIQFKAVPSSIFRDLLGEHITANRLILGIQPEEQVRMTFQAKVPGPMCLRSVTMHFDYGEGAGSIKDSAKMDAYAKVILDCMLGDHTLFWRQDGVELCWGFLTPILLECDCPEQNEMLHLYKAGTWGPQAAQQHFHVGE